MKTLTFRRVFLLALVYTIFILNDNVFGQAAATSKKNTMSSNTKKKGSQQKQKAVQNSDIVLNEEVQEDVAQEQEVPVKKVKKSTQKSGKNSLKSSKKEYTLTQQQYIQYLMLTQQEGQFHFYWIGFLWWLGYSVFFAVCGGCCKLCCACCILGVAKGAELNSKNY